MMEPKNTPQIEETPLTYTPPEIVLEMDLETSAGGTPPDIFEYLYQ